MNRKIFTLLASALALFSTAFYASARSVADKSVGALVKTLPAGLSKGMYHIQIDSIYVKDGSEYKWIPVTYEVGSSNRHLQYEGPELTYQMVNHATTATGDTIVLSITEGGEVAMISARDLREKLFANDAHLPDLQATMWCIDLLEDASSGQHATYHFTNKIFNKDLDYTTTGVTLVGPRELGWRYSDSYNNGLLRDKQPLYRSIGSGKRVVITAQLDGSGWPTGKLLTKEVDDDKFVTGKVEGMLKFSIVKISPFVLSANDFNTQLNNAAADRIQLQFDPVPTLPNYFGYKLYAESALGGAGLLDYLNVKAYDQNGTDLGYIRNSNRKKSDDANKYNNAYGIEYLNITAGPRSGTDISVDNNNNGYNNSYRFVYFPSEDSLVINAYHVNHNSHSVYNNSTYTDDGSYVSDQPGDAPYYYGLYNEDILYAQIVHLQDLTNEADDDVTMMTIASHPSNVRIFFGINNCEEMLVDAWQPAQGVYTIWDSRGRCLGVRIYNGTYTPQWLELYPGECPDRIPAYQWAIEPELNSSSRVKITNREFGSVTSDIVRMNNVLVKRGSNPIFTQQSQFKYNPIIPKYTNGGAYEPITIGKVKGEYLPVVEISAGDNCGLGGTSGYSGFRPVNKEFLKDPYLGYKHFYVDQSNGKSEDSEKGKGMDYNAYAFSYLHNYYETGHISLEPNYNDTLLQVDGNEKTGFQFILGDSISAYKEEEYGYPRSASSWSGLKITDVAPYHNPKHEQSVPVLKRYHYKLKVADFYQYRDDLSEQYVVLKGAKADHSDIKNLLKYGVADVYSGHEGFKFANVYLRESFFLPREKSINEERNPIDESRRIYYVMLDRIGKNDLNAVTSFGGLEVSDTLKSDDGTSFSLLQLGVDDKDAWVKAIGKTGNSIVVSPFALENLNYPLYRRLRSKRDDGATEEGDGVNPELGAALGTNLDAPKTLRIYRDEAPLQYLHEDGLSDTSLGKGIKFLGLANAAENKEDYALDGTVKYNFHLFIDTAYINRGTGWIKPQYLIAVGQTVFKGKTITGTDNCGDPTIKTLIPYITGRYLVNATDSSRVIGSSGHIFDPIRDDRFVFDEDWDRLAFVPAIHTGDRLYIISELEKAGYKESDWTFTGEDGTKYVDGEALKALNVKARTSGNRNALGAYYEFGAWNNYHNDVCFSLRFRSPDAVNPDANGDDEVEDNFDKRFYIESETKDRDVQNNRKIAPVQGGWIKIENWVPVLSRTSYKDDIIQGDVFNVEKPTSWQDGQATSNESVTEKVGVIAGEGSVSVLNAAGKQVAISNMLGQTIVNKALVGSNETISVPKGVAIVTVEGEKAVKVIIK
ncbi:MAG: DUF6383 domain-containing protein [Tannerella sp.]|jgi:hypothetical protein|nr:DUF6383 domain-containing protein [Tannerella sp.]